MKRAAKSNLSLVTLLVIMLVLTACSSSSNKNPVPMTIYEKQGTYGYDVAFFKEKNIQTIELKDKNSQACLLLVPGYQGRVMTSTMSGKSGTSFGWINYKFIESGVVSSQFNPFGGEERIWLGPEGGPFSIYFRKGEEQVFSNWIVPKEIDTEPFNVIAHSSDKVSFSKNFTVNNASGAILQVGIERIVKLLNPEETVKALAIDIDSSLSYVAYESENTLINTGSNAWTEKTGLLSIWMLSMFNPSPRGLVFIPFKEGSEAEAGKAVNDDYFGKVPADRLKIKNGTIFFKTDGKYRSKIGITPQRALPFCGSYDPDKKVLTLLWYSAPQKPVKYVNSKWGAQDDPLSGDVVNSYNDGPVEDGSIMGPFYEIESSSPAALLPPGGRITHTQRIFHITGDEQKLSLITERLFGQKLSDIVSVF